VLVKRVIAIDGPSGAGKSTLARLIAKGMGFEYLDTGALYRAVALELLRLGVKEDAADREIGAALMQANVGFRDGRVLLNGEDVTDKIRANQVSHYASVFSARRPVREYLLDIQRDAAMHADLVAEGRDMTTVVFPEAYKKFYLDASIAERARRRTLELTSSGMAADEEQVRIDITERDCRDSGRDIAPLRKAEDAHVIDSSGIAVEEVFRRMMGVIRS
jgi:cytidylate kinase